MKLADLPLDTILPPRIRFAERDGRDFACPECGGRLMNRTGDTWTCAVCEADFLEVEEAHDL
jgi:DNA-directed RNA polymerase subunit RPC12/RpoP